MDTGTDTGKDAGTERAGRHGQNGTRNGGRGRSARAGQATEYGGRKFVRWWGMCWSTIAYTRERVSIRFGTYNICNGRNRGL